MKIHVLNEYTFIYLLVIFNEPSGHFAIGNMVEVYVDLGEK